MASLNVEDLKSRLKYNSANGCLTWLNGPRKGCIAGSLRNDKYGLRYWRVKIKEHYIDAHRVAWAIFYGAWPDGYIDHIDGDCLNNKIDNLRIVTPRVNSQNNKRARAGKLTGAYKRGNMYYSMIRFEGRQFFIGVFDTELEAHNAYLKAEIGLMEE